jgi:hypothetical protein
MDIVDRLTEVLLAANKATGPYPLIPTSIHIYVPNDDRLPRTHTPIKPSSSLASVGHAGSISRGHRPIVQSVSNRSYHLRQLIC